MIVYQAIKEQFLRDHDDRDIEEVIQAKFQSTTERRVAESELRSWHESLGFMARVLRDEEIPEDAGIAVECHIPQSAKRIEVTLTGYDEHGANRAVVIELKQWEHARATEKDAIVVTYLAKAEREVVHPSYQAACSDRAGPGAAEPTSAGDRETVDGFRMPADQAEIARPAPAPALDPRLPVNQAYTAEIPRDPSVHPGDQDTTVAMPMPFAHEALHAGTGASTTPAASR